MSTEEFHHGRQEEEEEPVDFHNPCDGVEDDEEETLSLCDLPIYGGEESSREDHDDSSYSSLSSSFSSSSSLSSDEEFFEFSSSPPLKAMEPENIIFCGKLIRYKRDQSPSDPEKPRTRNVAHAALPDKNVVESAKKVQGIKSFSSSKWFLLAFGLMKYPGRIDARDIKSRQSKRGSSTPLSSKPGCGVGGEIVEGDRIKGKGPSVLLRALGCAGQSANSMVKVSYGCVPKI